MKSIIFVCLGNICRSPIAEGCAKKLAIKNNLEIRIESAGTGSWHIGELPCDNSIKVCQSNDVDISTLKASQFTKKDIAVKMFLILTSLMALKGLIKFLL